MTRPPASGKSPRPVLRLSAASGEVRATPPRPPLPDLIKVCGLPAVTALFARDPLRVERLFHDPRMTEKAADFCKTMAARRKPYRLVPTEELTKVAGTPLHGGIVAVAHPKPVATFDIGQARDWARDGQPLIILDGIGNPHNLGAIARTMAFFGLEHLLLSDHPAQALPSDAAFRVAEGGLDWINLYRTEKLARTLAALKDSYRVIGTALGSHHPVDEALTPGGKPLAVILGNEENGMAPETLAMCDAVATIGGSGRVQSLNVAATAAILAHLLTRKPAS